MFNQRQKIKEFIKSNKWLMQKLSWLNRMLNPTNKWKIARGNALQTGGAFFDGCLFRVEGTGNTIRVEPGCRLHKCRIYISGNNNTICIGADGLFLETEFYIEDDNNVISVGQHACFCGKTQLASIEGTTIEIGRECLFSSNIQFRTGDSHSIIDKVTEQRINSSAGITIGNHVWIGANVICLKGVYVAPDCVIGSAALLNKKYEEPGCIIAGVPASIKKTGVTWKHERI